MSSFRLTRQKLSLGQLKDRIPLVLYNLGKWDGRRMPWNNTFPRSFSEDKKDVRFHDGDMRQLIELYQLDKSQLVFSVTELIHRGKQVPLVYEATSAYSIIISAQTSPGGDLGAGVQYVPRVGDWQGGGQILMVIPRLDRRKSESLHHRTSIDVEVESFSFRSTLRRCGDEHHDPSKHQTCRHENSVYSDSSMSTRTARQRDAVRLYSCDTGHWRNRASGFPISIR